MSERGFLPAATTGISVADTTARVAFATASSLCLAQNIGAKTIYFKMGDSSVTATTSDTPLGPGGAIVLDQGTFTYMAAIAGSGDSSTFKLTSGSGYCEIANSATVAISGITVTTDSQGTATAAAPSYSEGTSNDISMNLSGDQRVVAKLAAAQTLAAVTVVDLVTAVTTLTTITNPVQTRQAANTTGTQSIVASSSSDVTILASNASRRGATVFNESTQILYLLLSSATSSATVYTVQMAAASYYEVPFGYSGVIKGIWASANGNARITEITA